MKEVSLRLLTQLEVEHDIPRFFFQWVCQLLVWLGRASGTLFFYKTGLIYEKEVVAAILERDRFSNTVVDVGSNKGYLTAIMGSRAPKVIAIDPIAANCRTTRIVFKMVVRRRTKLVVIEKAISDFVGTMPIYTAEGGDIGTLYSPHSHHHEAGTVSVCRLRDVLQGENAVDLVKLDVEGAELPILRDSEGIMTKIKEWIVEVHFEKDRPEIMAIFQRNGFAIAELDKDHYRAWKP